MPAWWQPTRVIGFDMSGNEHSNLDDLSELLGQLKDISAKITIHAGEAASAKSIWAAVHQWSARRIGHGLKLREEDSLLRYCVDEGICMEMCPISNFYTNYFEQVEVDYSASNAYHYPLRHYFENGLPVCINTDNRSLHPEGLDSLTADYLMAARLSGGLTKWEMLGLVKAGFRHSFLSKTEIAIFLDAVEDRVFTLWRG
jgi:adenosine deaminase